MSYCFDVMRRAFEDEIRPRMANTDESERLAEAFVELIDAMHNANHRLPSADGVFKGDGLNKDNTVHRAARDLERIVNGETEER